jgi:hypothetical protein
MTETLPPFVEDYLRRLRRSLRDLPRGRRDEIVDEIREHVREALVVIPSPTESDVRNVLDRIGEPSEIAADARERFGMPPTRAAWIDIAAICLVLIGGVALPILGWFIGVALLWTSRAWTTRDKLIGTLLIPGGLLAPLFFGLASAGSGGCVEIGEPGRQAVQVHCVPSGFPEGAVALVGLFLIPFVTAFYLEKRRHRAEFEVVR